MDRSYHILAVLVFLLFSYSNCVNPPDNIGKEYMVMFMENYKLDQNRNFPLELYVSTTGKTDAHVHVSSPLSVNPKFDTSITVRPGEVKRINISEEFRMKGNSLSSKGLLVESNVDIAVYGSNKDTLSNDVYCAIPTDAVGSEYYAMCYGPAQRKTELGVVATSNDTSVSITLPSKDASLTVDFAGQTYKAGETIKVQLDRYKTLQIQSTSDLTGAHIACDKPVAAFSGNIKTNIGIGKTADHIVEQLTPVDTWGKTFVTAPIPKRTTGDYFRIVASEDNTNINIPGMAPINIPKAGEWAQVQIPSDEQKLITANKPVLLAQFVLSQQNDSEPADPSMMIIPPFELFGAKYTFSTPKYSRPDYGAGYAYTHEFIVIANDTERQSLLLDDRPFPTNAHWKNIAGTNLVSGYVTVPEGSHTVRNSNPTALIGGYLYGHGFHESYGFPTGMRLAKINTKCTVTKTIPGDGIDNDCDGKIDEELCTNGNQDVDGDGKLNEDCALLLPVDGSWSNWQPWGACSVTCENGTEIRRRICDHPSPAYGGKNCSGLEKETRPCDTLQACPVDVDAICKKNKTAVIADPFNCAQYYDCSHQKSVLGKAYLKECKYPQLFSTETYKCQNFTTVSGKCGRRKEVQAPCQYLLNQCNGSKNCVPCPDRLPSCVGKADGNQPFPGKQASPLYIQCKQNRTIDVKKCKLQYFDPRTRKCENYTRPILNFLCQNKTATIPHPTNCAKYYDCSKNAPSIKTMDELTSECKYPDLYSDVTGSCQPFKTVNCDNRREPMEPCEYDQNLCTANNRSCVLCPKRLPGCRGQSDGHEPFPGKLWQADYIDCDTNRTMNITQCPRGEYFNPRLKNCMKRVPAVDVPGYCTAHPKAILPKKDNCGQYYNCSDPGFDGNHTAECSYPDLFSLASMKCEQFKSVACKKRTEPQEPCEYQQNLCPANNKSCVICPKRLPGCRGRSDGHEPFPGKLWQADYIDCDTNRTVNITQCLQGTYFNPRMKKCMKKVPKVDVPDYCIAHPKAILLKEDNCGQYYNCSHPGFDGNHTMECQYPDLFSTISMKCEQFKTVTCDKRTEPQEPCEYQQNLCPANNKSCVICPKRLPGCRGQSDGHEPFPGKLWQDDYIDCDTNRTMNITQCPQGEYFNPRLKKCMKRVPPVDVPDYCTAHPKAILPKEDNCGQYYNCSDPGFDGNHTMECTYPDLFSTTSMKCELFKTVTCNKRTEPQEPCEYQQNLCLTNSRSCVICPKRLPGCRGQSDGHEPFPGKLWQADYIDCDTNRTMNITQCSQGEYFNPRLRKCMKQVPTVDVPDFCTAHPKAILPKEGNCAQYYNCSDPGFDGNHTMECKYPDLFSLKTVSCQVFESVACDRRKEPQAPCEYHQNLCVASNKSCAPCDKRLPSCVSLPDGNNPIKWLTWKPDYAVCYKNRTMKVEKCGTRFFDPIQRKCIDKANPSHVDEICKKNPKAVLRKEDNCAQFYNCSIKNSAYGAHIQECKYPDLFSVMSLKCEDFKTVTCDKRPEPQEPCEYQQNLCASNNKSCVICPKRLPGCRGQSDGHEPFPGRLWKADYIDCDTNRTMNITQCPQGEYFNPRLKKCMKRVPAVDVPDYCTAHPKAILPKEDNCGQYYNCSDPGFDGNHTMECTYPDLFSITSMKCEQFKTVTCNKRTEPQEPCEYQQNLCPPNSRSCVICPKRLPGCRGQSDGHEPFPGKLWQADYIDCDTNRTMNITQCPQGEYFNPRLNKCMKKVPAVDVPDYCTAHPKAILPKEDNCGQYYNCSDPGFDGNHTMECTYPDLFSTTSMKCEQFKTVTCNKRTEPQEPCEYQQNLCPANSRSCVICPKRLPGCRGQSDGHEPFPGKLWEADYIDCDTNRTMNITQCPQGKYFNPRLRKCMKQVPAVDVPDFCTAHPKAILPKEGNCAQYYNCSDPGFDGNHTMECKYPDLFSLKTMSCQVFESVACDRRKEPQAPCEYHQNLCVASNKSCVPCDERLPSCVSLPDGNNPIKWLTWKPDYAVCYKNRTMKVEKCGTRFFDPIQRKCIDKANPSHVDEICKKNPKAVLRKEDNCAQFYNCSIKNSAYGAHTQECKYPDLFSVMSLKCEDFKTVTCDKRPEPQEPCEYQQNLCAPNNKSCVICPKRLPGCRGQSDGHEPFPGKLWQADYIDCDTNRTMNITQCPQGEYFNPRLNKCMKKVPAVDVPDYCTAHPKAILPKEDNCGQYYNCSDPGFDGNHTMECTYPDLFSTTSMKCEQFKTVTCNKRTEPQEPCEYQQNLCPANSRSCVICPKRLPGCRGQSDGHEPFPGKLWEADYIDCDTNRTMNITQCPQGKYFNPRLRKCMKQVPAVDVPDFCTAHPKAILPKEGNCAQYYNCSDPGFDGNHTMECKYPDLFSLKTMSCQVFESVACDRRKEPQAPCEYHQNLCVASNKSCVPCDERLPSCVSLPDGNNPIKWLTWKPDYAVCYKNRTMKVEKCGTRFFDPIQRKCIDKANPSHVDEICKKNPKAVLRKEDNCAQFYNCSIKNSAYGAHTQECKYPDLFSVMSLKCEDFKTVTCDKRPEPQEPCEYQQNLCAPNNKSCVICPKRLPGCRGQSDGHEPFPGKLWQADYIDCDTNRTMNITQCPQGEYFNPRLNKCMKKVPAVDVPDYCTAHPKAILPKEDNCGQYYNCSDPGFDGNHTMECTYPDLFSTTSMKCEQFKTVTCNKRTEPQEPCEYQQNLCPANSRSCVICPKRLPGCRGQSDGHEPFPGKLWEADYIDCDTNRTMNITQCPQGKYFNPRLRKCMKQVPAVDVPDFCTAHPKAILPKEGNCAQYYNCSDPGFDGNHTMECKYPDLFSLKNMSCQVFESVACDRRKEPQAPCEYHQNLCVASNKSCVPCDERLPSCVSLPDGNNPIKWLTWKPDYAVCYKNRTMKVEKCGTRFFDPIQRKCIDKANPSPVDEICKKNPKAIFRKEDNCAQFYNCSVRNSSYGGHIQECKYPDLFSVMTLKCENFKMVTCDKRPEPQEPCEYQQNVCAPNNKSCVICPKRLPGCRGQSDGHEPFPGKLWQAVYIDCDTNRTMNITQCAQGEYFNPRLKKCMKRVPTVDVPDYCTAHPKAILPKENNCGQYYNCSDPGFDGNHTMECTYPDLFSTTSMKCEQFKTVTCNKRTEPQEPCEYQQNLCPANSRSCVICPKRLPGCRGQSDGHEPFPGKLWEADYIDCDTNRTMNITQCPQGKYFNPRLKKCMKQVPGVDVPGYCTVHPKAIVPKENNCGQYYNCSYPGYDGNHEVECKYPDLFSVETMSCQGFENVACGSRKEPQAPCEYKQNLCRHSSEMCEKCPLRLPSCVGKKDGNHSFIGHLWESLYITCYKNRTVQIGRCQHGYFHPFENECKSKIGHDIAPDFCKTHARAVIPNEDNCAKYYNCSEGNHIQECLYPNLFSRITRKCETFTSVSCDDRPVPQAPCEYQQNICPVGNRTCEPCAARLPSCVGKDDGKQSFPARMWTPWFIECYRNRTVNVGNCGTKVFDPTLGDCVAQTDKVALQEICKLNPNLVRPNPYDCAQFIDCSNSRPGYVIGDFLKECPYPKLFSPEALECQDFWKVTCGIRKEPRAPCEYQQNICPVGNKTCEPCAIRLPSCVGKEDGKQSFPGRIWTPWFIECYRNRTVNVGHCGKEIFDPKLGDCAAQTHKVPLQEICRQNPNLVQPNSDDCGQFIDCSNSRPGYVIDEFRKECPYPKLFSTETLECQDFWKVTCGIRKEPRAPCEYQQNICPVGNSTCELCTTRLPSCVGKQDGKQSFPERMWTPWFIECYRNRTITVGYCGKEIFDPKLGDCAAQTNKVPLQEICRLNPNLVKPNPDDCGQFIDCSNSRPGYVIDEFIKECPYPKLFSTETLECQDFWKVTCGIRKEPRAPCEYQQNICPVGNKTCEPCATRLPSCVGKQDGKQSFPERMWTPWFIECYRNRTVNVGNCGKVAFDPKLGDCAVQTNKVPSQEVCKLNPNSVHPHPDDCAQFIDCSKSRPGYVIKDFIKECPYPKLFSTETLECQDFWKVTCGIRKEPRAPCEYQQNVCPVGNGSCEHCPKRLPSCVGKEDGEQGFPGRLWTLWFIECYKNRTINVGNCGKGVFDPNIGDCVAEVDKETIDRYCKYHPAARTPNPKSCMQFFDCNMKETKLGNFIHECVYPQLFDQNLMRCTDPKDVVCGSRFRPKSPCEYELNKCRTSDCIPCAEKYSLCQGKADGNYSIPRSKVLNKYVICHQGVAVEIKHCAAGEIFSDQRRACVITDSVALQEICKLNPNLVRPNPYDCAQFIDCSNSRPGYVVGEFIKECSYPNLFSLETLECQEYWKVTCGVRKEPRAPCEYLQNLCPTGEQKCKPCFNRLPSCIGLPDGMNPVMELKWRKDYIVCQNNRTLAITACTDGVFDPYNRVCMKDSVSSYCLSHPQGSIPNPRNCAQFYDCKTKDSEYGFYLNECQYPYLYEIETQTCQHFSKVTCGSRYEPVEPCEYIQNQCIGPNCGKCSSGNPSCRGLPDGPNAYPGREMTWWYIVCSQGRTVSVEHCHVGIFDQQSRMCMTHTAFINGYCERHPGSVIPSFSNCAQFYKCGMYNKATGNYLHECAYPKLYDIASNTCKDFNQVSCGERKIPQAPCDYEQNQCHESSCIPCKFRTVSCVGKPNGKNPVKGDNLSYVFCMLNRTIYVQKCVNGYYFEPYVKQCIPLKFHGLIPFAVGQDICKHQLVSGQNPVPDSAFSASSYYSKGSTSKDYSVARARINTTESKDAKGVLHLGAWSAKDLDVDQYIQVDLNEASLIRGVMTQGRNGCCQQWITKYRVLYSLDCGNNTSSWHAVSGQNVNDTFFKGNTDENGIVTNDFDCPVIARCIRINPLEWHNHISMRFDLLGCQLDTGNKTVGANTVSSTTASPSVNSTTPTSVNSTTPTSVNSTTPTSVNSTTPTNTSNTNTSAANNNVTNSAQNNTSNNGSKSMTQSASNVTTAVNAVNVTTAVNVISTTNVASVTTAATTAGATTVPSAKNSNKGCIKTCKGKPSGEYRSCKTCDGYVTCVWGMMYDRPCPPGLKWNDNIKVCDWPANAACAVNG